MALECAHCGGRAADGATRCPQCLRATGLVSVAAPAARRRIPRRCAALAAVAAVALGGAAVGVGVRLARTAGGARDPRAALAGLRGVAPEDLPVALGAGPALGALVRRARGAGDALAQARDVMDALGRARDGGAALATGAADCPPVRAPDGVFTRLGDARAVVTELDLARLEAAVLRAAGVRADVAERTTALRPGVPADPSGVLGSYVVLVAGHAVDPGAGVIVAAADARPRALGDRALAGAMLAQAALHEVAVPAGRRDRAVRLADGAVEAWPDGAVALAARAHVVRAVGASGGAAVAVQDLAAAVALRDAAPLRLLRARLELATPGGNPARAATEAAAARALARRWGPAALAEAALATSRRDADAGDGCAALDAALDAWAADAALVCRRASTPPDAARAAAERLMAAADDPLRIAYAAAGGAEGAASRVRAADRDELVGWLVVLGRADLAAALSERRDGGT